MALVKQSLVQVANSHVAFPTAARWAGIQFFGEGRERGVKVRCPFGDVEHPDGGRDPALRIYPDHGWCFACQKYYTPVSLLAEVWQVSREDAAVEALRRVGYVPANYAHLWENANRDPEPDRQSLGRALTTWCAANSGGWTKAQYDPAVAQRLSQCLGLLPLVRTEKDCRTWLAACKRAMGPFLSGT